MTEEIMPDIEPPWEWIRELAGERVLRERGKPGITVALPRNGLPEPSKPYVYRGTGEDQLLGTYGDKWLDKPRDW